ncbi:hypothetical protein AJ79_00026 [Helicocarpus griseus UAMH5409]|uniref:Rhodopsin domain-containing protein n=1 Tax=Helicocarpus griseus UAMH5409 TaxID=1447875 RepID=A0A2B7YD83_9EURO|nr:hypothetical protein AJ79_00026 [Helicocarpus griseus UAMH5409]
MNVTKVSILFFYLRIFTSRDFKVIAYSVMGITVAYGTAVVLAVLFQCQPVHMAWKHWDGEHEDAKCANINLIGWISAAINIVLDVIIIVLPVRELFRLALSTKKKLHILLMFGVGFFVTIVSAIRLKSFLQFGNSHNITWDHVEAGYWSTIEGHASIFCACMPAIRALLRKLSPSLFGDRTSSANTRDNRSTGVKFGGSAGGGRVFSHGGGPQSPLASPTKKVSAGWSESDVFPLVERGDWDGGHAQGMNDMRGFGSYTTIKSNFKK